MIEILGVKISAEVLAALAFVLSELIGASKLKQNGVVALLVDQLARVGKSPVRRRRG
jgi:hypothetical protein